MGRPCHSLTRLHVRGCRTIVSGLLAAAAWALLAPGLGRAQELCPGAAPPLGRLVSIHGKVDVNQTLATLGLALCPGDRVAVGAESRAAVHLYEIDTVLRLDERTRLDLPDAPPGERTVLDLLTGALNLFSETPKRFEVRTPFVDGGVEGTEFQIRVELDDAVGPVGATMRVFEGTVLARNEAGEARLAAGEELFVNGRCDDGPESCIPLSAPVAGRLEIAFEDAVAWSVYYPPLVPDPDDLGVPEVLRRAAGLLAAGRVEAVDALLADAPETAASLAIRAVAALALNRRDQALAFAERAVADAAAPAPARTAALLALSYVRQAMFALDAARDAVIQAAEVAPDDGLVQARLAELDLALGERRAARAAAARAVELAPDLARPRLIQGFAALAAIDTKAARAAFEAAMARDPNDPLAFLGLGLAIIRDGDLASGRAQIEIATALDPANALVRSYLGKAYFDELRSPADAIELATAKQRDPNDPTPWFYDAIRLQTENRPVEALAALKRSIALNDNRAPYRSRLLLDQDRAARGASLARIYDQLGFAGLGVNEATESLAFDPANASAHRFLSDIYRDVRRRELARVSELLQAQLLQEININPVQPSASETNLNIVTGRGPAEPGLNEYTALFERNRAQLSSNAAVGDDDTYAGEAVGSLLHGKLSVSGGVFHYETDGWRDNHDISHNIQDVFAQLALTPEVNVQLEVSSRDSREGDLALNFDPTRFLDMLEREIDQDTVRLGARYSPGTDTDFLLSLIRSDRTEFLDQAEPAGAFTLTADGKDTKKAWQYEGQVLHRYGPLSATAGASYLDIDGRTELTAVLGPFPIIDISDLMNTNHRRAYLYVDVNYPMPVVWTFGASYDDYDETGLNLSEVNPKLGVQVFVTDDLRLRAAWFRTVKPALASNRTIEPTQVAGFNQFFDDLDATKATRWGAGFDWDPSWHPLRDVQIGGEMTWRQIDEPTFIDEIAEFEGRDERLHQAYLYWTPLDEVAVAVEFHYDRYRAVPGGSDVMADNLSANRPEYVRTISVPVRVRYFARCGLFAGFSATYVDQRVRRTPPDLPDGEDQFYFLDAAVGWRLPARRGAVGVEVRNLLDADFNYQDDSFREFGNEPAIGPYIPSRTIMARATLIF